MLVAPSHLVPLLPAQQLLLHNLPQGHPCPHLQRVQPRSWPGSVEEIQQTQQAQLAVDDINGGNGQLQQSRLLRLLGGALVAEVYKGLSGLTLVGGLVGGLAGSRGAGDDPWGELLEHGLVVGAAGGWGHQRPPSCYGPQIEANGCCVVLQVAMGDQQGSASCLQKPTRH